MTELIGRTPRRERTGRLELACMTGNRWREKKVRGDRTWVYFTTNAMPSRKEHIASFKEWCLDGVRSLVVTGLGEWKTDGCVVDFIGWVRRVVLNDHRQQVFLKVDIEGAEYTVVRELLDSGVLKGRVKWVAIEWHGKIVRKIKGFDHKARQEAIINDLKAQGVEYIQWGF
ncbi:hypothetical protein FOL46_007263 [Perkinsus olseni]|uniref:Methyltransferase FkbM domain-containing protein n=1 Tax=Perkinsus olseni TaxID=32597 RepID=A0A7J6LF00_PEROL|nr:hypothetical protein FOL46_007263 [Perkinsus olseni]